MGCLSSGDLKEGKAVTHSVRDYTSNPGFVKKKKINRGQGETVNKPHPENIEFMAQCSPLMRTFPKQDGCPPVALLRSHWDHPNGDGPHGVPDNRSSWEAPPQLHTSPQGFSVK